jgi:hypothetical protein
VEPLAQRARDGAIGEIRTMVFERRGTPRMVSLSHRSNHPAYFAMFGIKGGRFPFSAPIAVNDGAPALAPLGPT